MALNSPCTKICTLDFRTGWCIGCLRSGEEIGRWVAMRDAERQAVLVDRNRREAIMRRRDPGLTSLLR